MKPEANESKLNEFVDELMERVPSKLVLVCVIDPANFLHVLSGVNPRHVKPSEIAQLDMTGDVLARAMMGALTTVVIRDPNKDKEPPA